MISVQTISVQMIYQSKWSFSPNDLSPNDISPNDPSPIDPSPINPSLNDSEPTKTKIFPKLCQILLGEIGVIFFSDFQCILMGLFSHGETACGD